MRIALVVTGLGLGGAEVQVCAIADELVSRGHEVILISLTGPIMVRPNDVPTVYSLSATKSFFSMIKAYFSCMSLLRAWRPDVVHSHMFHANIFLRLLRPFLFQTKLISSAHSNNEGGG